VQHVPFGNDEEVSTSVQPKALTAPYPASTVEVTGTAILRGRHVVVLRFRPLQYRPGGHATYTREAQVRIVFRDAPPRGTAPKLTEPMHAALSNAAVASRWPLAGSSPRSAARSTLPDERLRIRIGRRGVYALRGADLLAAGVPIDSPSFDPRTLRLYFDPWKSVALLADSTPASWQPDYEMREAAIWVPGEEDGAFDPLDDRVVFYALGPEGYEDLADSAVTDSLAYFEHPYDRNQYAWLVWGGAFGRRMQVVSAAAPEPIGDPLVTRVWHREHLEQNRTFARFDDLWYWERISFSQRSVSFDLDLGGDAAATADLRVSVGAIDAFGQTIAADFALNQQPLGRIRWVQSRSIAYTHTFQGASIAPANVLEFIIAADETPNENARLMEMDATWERALAARTYGKLEWLSQPKTDREIYELTGFASQPLLFDVSQAFDPVRLVDPTPAASVWRVRAGRGAGVRAHFLAVAAPDSLDPEADLELRIVPQLRSRATSPDVLIVTHESTRAAAERLATHRAAHFPGGDVADVLVATTRDIYDNFSGGRLDPLAIRNYIKFLYNLSQPEPRLQFVVLFGDATYDPRQLLPGTAATLVPALYPLAAHPWFLGRFEAIEDWFVEMDTPLNGTIAPTGSSCFPVADMPVGRLPVRDPAAADRVVDRIVAYETTTGFGGWRGRVLSASDDECTPSSCFETFWVSNNERLLQEVWSDLDIEKLYLTEYGRVQSQKPHARRDFIRTWSEGATVVNWNGHGSSAQLADEGLLYITDVPSLANGPRLPLFLELGEQGVLFDRPADRIGEAMLSSEGGGAIGVISSTDHTYAGPSFTFNRNLFRELLGPSITTPTPLGVALQAAKVRGGLGSGNFLESYMLLGDPALSLGLPGAEIEFDAGADTLVAGQRAHIQGFVHARGDSIVLASFNGTADIEVLGSADESGYTLDDPRIHLDYDLPGAPLFRGTVPVVNGRLAVDFTVPVMALARGDSLRVSGPRAAVPDTALAISRRTLRPGPKARLSVYATSASLDAKGARNDVCLKRRDGTMVSTSPPRIAFRFPNDTQSVLPNATAAIEIRDENGIAITGGEAGSIRVQFDDRSPLDVTGQYRCTSADTVGSVDVTVPVDLAPGAHRVAVFASDNLGNPALAAFEFTIVAAATGTLANVIAFPNPFRDRTHIFFDLDEPGEVEVSIHTTSGREVWSGKQGHEPGRGSVAWPGVDSAGDRLANGTYIYQLVARPSRPGASTVRYKGKVVVMR